MLRLRVLFGFLLKLGLTLTLILTFTKPNSVFAAIWPRCAENYVSELFFRTTLKELQDQFDDTRLSRFSLLSNYCDSEQSPDGIPAELFPMLDQVGKIASRAAGVASIEPEVLYAQGLSIRLAPSFAYYLEAAAGTHHLLFSIPPDWKGSDRLNESVFAHELGHEIVRRLIHIQPSISKAMDNLILSESIADLFAAETVGLGPSNGLLYFPEWPECFSKVRQVDPSSSFGLSAYFFKETAASHFMRCCDEMGPFEKWFSAPGRKARGFCNAIEAAGIRVLDMTEHLKKPFDPVTTGLELENVDPHKLSIPFTSFMMGLRESLGIPPIQLLFDSILESERQGDLLYRYRCAGQNILNGQTVIQEYQIPYVENALRGMRKDLAPTQQSHFDMLWENHQISKGMIVLLRDRTVLNALLTQDGILNPVCTGLGK